MWLDEPAEVYRRPSLPQSAPAAASEASAPVGGGQDIDAAPRPVDALLTSDCAARPISQKSDA